MIRSRAQSDLLLRLAEKGSRLREVRKDLLCQQPGVTQRWFQGPDGCDLFLWYDDSKGLSQLQLTFEKRVVEWSGPEGLRTGRLIAFNPLTPLNDQGRVMLDPSPEEATLELARAVLSQAGVDELTLALVRRRLGLKHG